MKNQAAIEEVRGIVAPEWTETWHPVSHAMVMDAVELAIDDAGIGVVNRRFELASKGNRVFANYTLDVSGNGIQYQYGWRNAIDKAFAVGFAAGTLVTICSNLMFKGDFLEFRKHTNGLEWDLLLELAKKATKQIIAETASLIEWQKGLREITLTEDEYQVLTYRALNQGAVAPANFHEFEKSYVEEVRLQGENLYSFHGAATRVMRGNGFFTISNKSKALNGLMEEVEKEYRSLLTYQPRYGGNN